ncbi:MAG: hypothetical protein DRH90_00830 [Deltaproteobacteria bacterium]|nr:MAG: hypothetical protein DRH90_00830 [Deltaproteobacteria bacterium]
MFGSDQQFAAQPAGLKVQGNIERLTRLVGCLERCQQRLLHRNPVDSSQFWFPIFIFDKGFDLFIIFSSYLIDNILFHDVGNYHSFAWIAIYMFKLKRQ